jgi:hypothetical protein
VWKKLVYTSHFMGLVVFVTSIVSWNVGIGQKSPKSIPQAEIEETSTLLPEPLNRLAQAHPNHSAPPPLPPPPLLLFQHAVLGIEPRDSRLLDKCPTIWASSIFVVVVFEVGSH